LTSIGILTVPYLMKIIGIIEKALLKGNY